MLEHLCGMCGLTATGHQSTKRKLGLSGVHCHQSESALCWPLAEHRSSLLWLYSVAFPCSSLKASSLFTNCQVGVQLSSFLSKFRGGSFHLFSCAFTRGGGITGVFMAACPKPPSQETSGTLRCRDRHTESLEPSGISS